MLRNGLINRDFRLLWFGQAISVIGDYAFDTTLLLWVATSLMRGRADAPVASSAVLVVVAVSAILTAPLAGVLVDRWDKRRTMLRADLVRFALIGLLTVVAALPAGAVPVPVTLVLIGVMVALATAASEFFNPARLVLVGDIVPQEQHGRASGYLQATTAAGAIIGPPLAAPLAIGLGVPWALGLNALSFLVSYSMIRAIRPPVPKDGPPAVTEAAQSNGILREFVAGLRELRANRVIVVLLVTSTLVMLGAGAVNALDVSFVQENLHASAAWFGVLGGAFGAGALLGSVIAGGLGDRLGHARVFRTGLFLAAGLFLVYSRMSSIGPAIVLVVFFSIGLGALNTASFPLILRVVPRQYLGRVASVFGPVAKVASIISISLAGAVVGQLPLGYHITVAGIGFGRIDAVFFVSAALMLGGAAYAQIALRGVDRGIDRGAGADHAEEESPAPANHGVATPK